MQFDVAEVVSALDTALLETATSTDTTTVGLLDHDRRLTGTRAGADHWDFWTKAEDDVILEIGQLTQQADGSFKWKNPAWTLMQKQLPHRKFGAVRSRGKRIAEGETEIAAKKAAGKADTLNLCSCGRSYKMGLHRDIKTGELFECPNPPRRRPTRSGCGRRWRRPRRRCSASTT